MGKRMYRLAATQNDKHGAGEIEIEVPSMSDARKATRKWIKDDFGANVGVEVHIDGGSPRYCGVEMRLGRS